MEAPKNKLLIIVFCLLAASFASYDLVVLYLGKATSLLNVRAHEGFRSDEGYMYLAGIGKTILFDPYLKEHAASLTLRPAMPTMLFTAIYWLCGRDLDVAIFVGHTVPPLVSCLLLYLIGMRLTGSRSLAVFAVLLAVGHFVYSLMDIVRLIMEPWPIRSLGGADLYLLKHLFGDSLPIDYIMAPIHFSRLFTPSLTLPLLLLPLWMVLRGGMPAVRGALIAANLYAYPHHIIVLGLVEIAFWLRDRKLPPPIFFIVGTLACVPYIVLNALVERAGNYADMYSRVGHTPSYMWFFVPFLAVATSLVACRRGEDVRDTRLAFTAGCLASAVLVWAADTFLKFPQAHLIAFRIFVYLSPLSLACGLRGFITRIPRSLNVLLVALVAISQAYAGWTQRHKFTDFPADGFPSELSQLPAGTVVMTDVNYEILYISAASDKYSYLAYGIVSAASNEELLRRFAVVSRIYGWSADRLHGGDWDGLIRTDVWVYHLGPPEPKVRDAAFDSAVEALADRNGCELLQIYRVDYIRFRQAPPAGLDACTAPETAHILRVVPTQ